MHSRPGIPHPTRRSCLLGSLGLGLGSALRPAFSQSAPKSDSTTCPRCGGLGRIPLKDAKSFVWIEGLPPPSSEAAVGEQACPQCQSEPRAEQIAAEVQEQLDTALAHHRQWEERTGWKLTCVLTRHAAL